jgi:outer membrane protein TolC
VDAEIARAVQQELQSAADALAAKLRIREAFLQKEIDAGLASLRVLESEAKQRQTALAPKADRARKELQDAQVRFQTGVASVTEVAEAQLRLSKIQLDLAQAAADLARIHERIAQRAR